MSGNSSRSWFSTSPIDECALFATTTSLPRPAIRGFAASARSVLPLATNEEGQPVATDLQLVAVLQTRLVDPLLVDVRTVQRARVAQRVTVGVVFNGHVTPRHGDVVEEDVGVGVAADRGRRLRQPERRAVA